MYTHCIFSFLSFKPNSRIISIHAHKNILHVPRLFLSIAVRDSDGCIYVSTHIYIMLWERWHEMRGATWQTICWKKNLNVEKWRIYTLGIRVRNTQAGWCDVEGAFLLKLLFLWWQGWGLVQSMYIIFLQWKTSMQNCADADVVYEQEKEKA